MGNHIVLHTTTVTGEGQEVCGVQSMRGGNALVHLPNSHGSLQFMRNPGASCCWTPSPIRVISVTGALGSLGGNRHDRAPKRTAMYEV